jgi:biopolymer transport protein ExbD
MTPMVDVAFLLLIFFMSTTQFKPPERISVQLPSSSSEIHVPETNTIVLTVNRRGETYISTERGTDVQQVPFQDVFNAVVSWRGRNPNAVVILKGDKEADFGAIADVMEALAQAKTLRFNLMTDLKRRRVPTSGTP